MWNENTSINEPEVVAIKDAIIKKGLADSSAFEVEKNFDVSSGVTHYPIIFIVDVSGSLATERVALNNAIRNFVSDILASRTTLSSSIDFSIVTFADKVKVKRPFAYISDSDLLKNSRKCSIAEDELKGLTYMGSGMFVAWYIAEKRKQMYKEAGMDYKQPVFILISDLGNNETTTVDGEYLMSKVISLYNMKSEKNKLGLLKALFGRISQEYNETLKGTVIDAPAGLADTLSRLFSMLISTIAAAVDAGSYISSDDDDVVFLGNMNPKSEHFTSDKLAELMKLYEDDDDE